MVNQESGLLGVSETSADLRDLLMDALTPSRMSAVGIQDYGVVRRTLASHMTGAFDESPRLWSLLVLSLWHDTHRARATVHDPDGPDLGG